jgi:hypothetical protein
MSDDVAFYREAYSGMPELVHKLLEDPDRLDQLRRDAGLCKKWMMKFLDHIDVAPSPSQREYLREQFSDPEECKRYVNEVLFPYPHGEAPQ